MPALEKDVVFLVGCYEVFDLTQRVGLFLCDVRQGDWREDGDTAGCEAHEGTSTTDLDSTEAQERRRHCDDFGRDMANDHHLVRV